MTVKKFEQRAQRAASLPRATPTQRVPKHMTRHQKAPHATTVALRCVNIRYRHEPRPIQVHDLCPACDSAYLSEVGWKEGLLCRECGWMCKTEQPVGGGSDDSPNR